MIVWYLWTPVMEDWYVVNPLHPTGLFLHPLETSENQKFSVFRGYRKRSVARNGLMFV